VLGMTTPFVRIPAELASGSTWQSKSKIKDTSDYLDSSIPGINYIANITGFSPTGSLGSLLTGQGLDQQRTIKSGDKGMLDQVLAGLNWSTGLGFGNMSRESFQTVAELEKRDRAR